MKSSQNPARECFEFGSFHLDPARRLLLHDGRRTALPSKAFDILLGLVENRGRVVDKDTLMRLAWPDTAVEENNLTKNIATLRKVLGDHPQESQYIVTVPGRGYSFVATVALAEPEAGAVRRKVKQRVAALAVGMAAVIGACAWLWFGRPPVPPKLTSLTGSQGLETMPAFSPDGQRVAYDWRQEGEQYSSIYVKSIGPGAPLRLTSGKPVYGPAWSPDGRYIAYYTFPGGGICLIPAMGGTERKVATVDFETLPVWFADRPAWFADGKRLAIVDRDPGTGFPSIYELSIDTGARRKLTTGVSQWGDTKPAFSPDGKTLGFVRSWAGGLMAVYLMPAGGGKPRQLTKPEEWAFEFDWTADSAEIVYCSNRTGFPTLWRLSVAGGTPQRVAAAGYDARQPVVARGASRMAFTRFTSSMNLWRMELDNPGSARRLAATTRAQKAPQFSPDGKKLAFESNRSGPSEIWTSDSEGGNVMQMTSMGALDTFAGTPRWSPDGAEIVFDARPGGNPDIYVVSAQGGAPRRITTHPAEDIVPSFSRDGRWIYFSSNRGGDFQIWKAPRSGGEAVQVTRQGGSVPMESPDGRYVLYIKRREPFGLWRIPSAGGPETQLLDVPRPPRVGASWAITDQGVVYADTDATLRLYDTTTGRARLLATLPEVPANIAVSPDGRSVALTRTGRARSSIMLLEDFR